MSSRFPDQMEAAAIRRVAPTRLRIPHQASATTASCAGGSHLSEHPWRRLRPCIRQLRPFHHSNPQNRWQVCPCLSGHPLCCLWPLQGSLQQMLPGVEKAAPWLLAARVAELAPHAAQARAAPPLRCSPQAQLHFQLWFQQCLRAPRPPFAPSPPACAAAGLGLSWHLPLRPSHAHMSELQLLLARRTLEALATFCHRRKGCQSSLPPFLPFSPVPAPALAVAASFLVPLGISCFAPQRIHASFSPSPRAQPAASSASATLHSASALHAFSGAHGSPRLRGVAPKLFSALQSLPPPALPPVAIPQRLEWPPARTACHSKHATNSNQNHLHSMTRYLLSTAGRARRSASCASLCCPTCRQVSPKLFRKPAGQQLLHARLQLPL
mmetsp:Transcript_121077/g.220172  ORF Transcript_121077/g.220172 Transcript_121077/m.220172 type:complete len:382 (+) Transcript_121077:856-2001(+)